MHTPIAVSIPEAVKASGMSRTSIYEALKRGELTAQKAGRRTLVSFSSLSILPRQPPLLSSGSMSDGST